MALRTAAILFVAALGLGAACLLAQGPLPGDVAATHALQFAAGAAPAWASFLTETAKAPLLWVTLSLSIALAYVRGGWPSAVIVPAALLSSYLADAVLRTVVFAPRPLAELVAVASPNAGSGLPSTFALFYGSLFGAVVFSSRRNDVVGSLVAALGAVLIAAGVSARVVLGGHWTSQILASLLLAFSIVVALHAALHRLHAPRH